MTSEYMTPDEVARFLGVSRKAVWRWSMAGRLPHHRTMGGPHGPGHRRYRRSDMEKIKERLVGLVKESA